MTDVVFAAIENRPELEKSLMQTIALERYGRPEEVSKYTLKNNNLVSNNTLFL